MAIHIALNHKTHYRYDRPVLLGPQTIRLRPAPHCRTPILAYSLKVLPQKHFINWQQDPQANYLARLVFPEKTNEFSVEVDLVAEMAIFNPFDFFLEPYAEKIPFVYESSLARELRPFLEAETPGPKLAAFLTQVSRVSTPTLDFLVSLNQRVQREISYVIRLEHGVQSCQETLSLGTGSCRDSAWLLVHILRNPAKIKSLILTGSSGLFENTMGGSYPRRGSYDYIRERVAYTFYDPNVASKDLVDEVFETTKSIPKCMRIVAIAKSAQRNNLANDLPNILVPTLLVWGLNDTITPPMVGYEFNRLIPGSELKFIDKCCHAPMMEQPDKFNELVQEFLVNNTVHS